MHFYGFSSYFFSFLQFSSAFNGFHLIYTYNKQRIHAQQQQPKKELYVSI